MVYSGFAMLCASTGEVMNIDGFGNDKVIFWFKFQSKTMLLDCFLLDLQYIYFIIINK